MTGPQHIAVIDVGKTNVKLALVDLATLAEIAVVTRPNVARPGPPWRHFDVEGHWEFLLDALRDFHRDKGIDAISITTHGASAVLLNAERSLAAPVLDYEDRGPDSVAAAYDAIRPDFAETGSPRLAMGLNVGAQIHWQFIADPGLRDRLATIVTYPQYWGVRLTGVLASDVSSLGCHTDLWDPHHGRYSSLVERLGLEGKIAPARPSADVLGPILPEIAARTGLRAGTPVHCGIHDSNASLLPHILGRAAPFSVVSTGTWVISMAIGGAAVTLDPARDTLINVSALGDPVPSARFMGGREHDLLLGKTGVTPTSAECAEVVETGLMLLPAVEPTTGPFQGQQSRWIGTEPPQGSGTRAAAVAYYLALVTARCLALIGHQGEVVVEGPFARNAAYRAMLSAATASPVIATGSATGTSQGAALLAAPGRHHPAGGTAELTTDPAMAAYAAAWQAEAGA